MPLRQLALLWVTMLISVLWTASASAAVLPEDRADALYHAYDGGGVTITGPSVLVRKSVKEKVSVYANYYQDVVTGASIDVISYGSPYREERTEYSLGADYLHEKTIMSVSYTSSNENDFVADTVSAGVSQDFFGDMTTLSLGYAQGNDIIRRSDRDPSEFEKEAERRRYSLGLTQVLTKNWILALNAETAVDDGFLRNPYRQVRDMNGSEEEGFTSQSWTEEVYPTTRNSDAFAIRTVYYLPYRASVKFEARTFADSWGIRAQNYEIRYTHPVRENLLLEIKARTYSQNKADFFYDYINSDEITREYYARDKELSTYSTNNFGMGVTYDFDYKIPYTKTLSLSAFWDFVQFDYEDFRDQCLSKTDYCSTRPGFEGGYNLGEEPGYSFGANVLRVFLTVNY